MKANKYDKDGDVIELGEDFFNNAKPVSAFPELQAVINTRGKQHAPTKQATTIRLSPEVLAYFKRGGKGWQTRINDTLLAYVAEHS